ncbi:hypothetical protein [Oceanisphaera sp.]|uniref:hypothetical protein n=1 Tax=Oceanisphaera sp. TaxID=1929979 RepID=UPI003A909159
MNLDTHGRVSPKQVGSMLLSVIFIIVILAGLMAGLATLSNQSSQQLVYEVQALKARLAAESALEQQVFILLNDIAAPAVNSPEIGGCDTQIKVTLPTTENGVTQVNVIATGACSTSQLTVIRNIEVEVIDK